MRSRWTVLVLVVARILGGGDPRLWLAAGAVAGVGLQNKQLPLLLVLALALGLAFDRRLLEALRSRWLWLGVVVACVIWFPNLIWQATHGWPQLELAEDIRKDEGGESRATLLPFQLLVIGPLLAPVWIAGLVALFRDRSPQAVALARARVPELARPPLRARGQAVLRRPARPLPVGPRRGRRRGLAALDRPRGAARGGSRL